MDPLTAQFGGGLPIGALQFFDNTEKGLCNVERLCKPIESLCEDDFINDAIKDQRHAKRAPIVGSVPNSSLGDPN